VATAQSRRDETHAKTRINHRRAPKPRSVAQAGACEHLGNTEQGYLTILKPACIKTSGFGLVDTFRHCQGLIGAIILNVLVRIYDFDCFNRLKRLRMVVHLITRGNSHENHHIIHFRIY
jgi:hypothetical protein